MVEEILIFIVFGALTGILAGLLGIGGGVITVPVLYYTLRFSQFPAPEIIHVAVATALASTTITSLSASWAHHQKKGIRFDALKWIVPGLALGCVCGAILIFYIPSDLLKMIFGVVVFFLGVYFFFPALPSFSFAPQPNRTLTLWSLGIGCLSTLLGIGGGLFIMPLLLGYQLPVKNAVATSSASTLVSGFFGTIALLFIAHAQESHALPHTIGYINLLALLALSVSSVSTTAVGAKLAHILPACWIKKLFACALGATGIAMFLGR